MNLKFLFRRIPKPIAIRLYEAKLWLRFQWQCLKANSVSPSLAARRYVISKRSAGLGDSLVSLTSAWRYAKMTRRTLIVDWRFSCYSNDPTTNVFPLLFHPVSEIDGVPVWCDQSIEHHSFPGPFYPPEWNSENVHAKKVNPSLLLTDVLSRRINMAKDIGAPSVVFHGCMWASPP